MGKFDYTKLSLEEQIEYNKVATQMFGETIIFSETGEYLCMCKNNTGYLNPIHQLVLDRMKINKNLN